MRRRELDGCPISVGLQMIGDKWTLLVARELANGPMRTMELHTALLPISSRTLVARLRDMEKDRLVTRTNFGGNPQRIEYELTERGTLLLPLADAFRRFSESLGCADCEDRIQRVGEYCEICPNNRSFKPPPATVQRPVAPARRQRDDSIVLL